MSNGAIKSASNIYTQTYKNGSIIYFRGDKSDVVYILKNGKVVLTSQKEDTGEEIKENIKVGEIFGVKSTIGRYPREEDAMVVGDTTVLVVGRADFEKMMIKNVPWLTKMLRVFSNQLRKVHKMQIEILGMGENINPATELYKIGEYYFKSGSLPQAKYVYKKYLEHYPGTKFSDQAMQRLKTINTGNINTDTLNTTPDTEDNSDTGKTDLTDFSLDDNNSENNKNADSMGDLLLDEKEDSDSDFSFAEPDVKTGGKDITELFYEAVSLFSQEKYNNALPLFKKILEFKTLKNDSENRIFEKAHFEIGRCYLKLNNIKEAVNHLSALIKKFPKSDVVKNAILHIGIAFEMAGNTEKATAYYNKVMTMEPKDSITKIAAKNLKALEK